MFKLIQISDCHLFADITKTAYQQINPYVSLRQVLNSVAGMEADLVLVTGDISGDHSLESYQHFVSLWQDSNCASELAVIAGNHDDPAKLHDVFGDRVLTSAPAFRHSGWHVHGLCSHYMNTLGRVSEQDLADLEAAVKAAPHANHLIAVHHHAVVTGGWMDRHEWTNAQEFLERVAGLPQIRVVINGHVHMERDITLGDCRYLSCPSSCWQFANTPEFALSDTAPGFRQLILGEDGQVDTRIIRSADTKP